MTASLTHLTAVHMLGRILENQDSDEKAQRGRHRYQAAMQHLRKAFDRLDQTLVVRQVLEANPAPSTGNSFTSLT